MRQLLAALVLAGALLPLLDAAAEAGPPLRLSISKQRGGPYENVITISLEEGERRSVYLKANNKADVPDHVTLTEVGFMGGYRTKYFRENGADITEEVKGTGFDFHLGAEKAKKFRLRVKRPAGADETGCIVTRVANANLEFAHLNINSEFACP